MELLPEVCKVLKVLGLDSAAVLLTTGPLCHRYAPMCLKTDSAVIAALPLRHRGHSRNRPKGGRNSPKRCTSTHLRTAFLSFYSQRGQNPLQITFPAVFGTKLRLIHQLDWFGDIK